MQKEFTEEVLNMKELGTILKSEREKKKETIASISRTLFIKKSYLEKFEGGRIKIESTETYVKGFLNTYAAYLDVDLSAHMVQISKKTDNKIKNNLMFSHIPPKQRLPGSIIILSSLILMGLVYIIWQRQTYFEMNKISKSISTIEFDKTIVNDVYFTNT